jgi:hypothetical protein
MEDIKQNNKCGNTAGYKSLYVIPLSEVEAVNFIDKKTKEVVPTPQGSFGKIDVYDIKVTSQNDADFYKNKITGNFRSVNDMAILFKKM